VRAALRRLEEVLERDVDEREPRLGQQLVRIPELSANMDAAVLLVLDRRAYRERVVDRHGPPVAEEHAAGDRGEAVPGRDEPAGLVHERGDQTAVDEPRPTLVALVEGEGRLVAVGALLLRLRQVEAQWVVAAPETGRVVVRRDPQRIPPRSKWALKKFSEPEVAIAAEAEISSARVAAATICAKR